MASDTLPLSELRGLSRAEVDHRLDALLNSTPNGVVTRISGEIAALESAHGISSEKMLEGLHSGDIRETEEVCHWVMLLRHLGRA